MSENKEYVLGIDVGGTNIKFGVIDPNGNILARRRMSTQRTMSNPEQLTAALIEEVRALWKQADLTASNFCGIGVGLPGLINPLEGVVIFLPNIPGWDHVPLQRILVDALGVPTFLENDVNLITLGEWQFGAGQGVTDLMCLTLGTGVGSGLIFNNQLYHGAGFTAGELGHVPLNETGPACNCGGIACLESYIGNRPLGQLAAKMVGREVTLEEMTTAGRAKDETAMKFWREVGMRLGNGLVGAVNLLNPKLIIVGGGVADGGYPILLSAAEEQIRARAMMVQGQMVKLASARLGSDAGIIGARVLVQQENGKRQKGKE